jgi:hypothetical protein
MENNNNVHIFTKKTDAIISIKPQPPKQFGYSCLHDFEIDEFKRIVICLKCLKSFDPIECLVIFAKYSERYTKANKELKKETEEKTLLLENIKKEIVNAKVRLASLLQKESKEKNALK